MKRNIVLRVFVDQLSTDVRSVAHLLRNPAEIGHLYARAHELDAPCLADEGSIQKMTQRRFFPHTVPPPPPLSLCAQQSHHTLPITCHLNPPPRPPPTEWRPRARCGHPAGFRTARSKSC